MRRKIEVVRQYYRETYTIGKLFIDGEYLCDTLEDKVRDLGVEQKIKCHTAIPCGEYGVTLTLSPRFKRVLPRLHDVPQFEGVLIHAGNTPTDTSGCILVGENLERGRVMNSRRWEYEVVKRLEGSDNIKIVIR